MITVDDRDMFIFYLLSLFISVCVKHSFPACFSCWIVDFNFFLLFFILGFIKRIRCQSPDIKALSLIHGISYVKYQGIFSHNPIVS